MSSDVLGAGGAQFGRKLVELAKETEGGGVTREEFESRLTATFDRLTESLLGEVAGDADISEMFHVMLNHEDPKIKQLGKALQSPQEPNMKRIYRDLIE